MSETVYPILVTITNEDAHDALAWLRSQESVPRAFVTFEYALLYSVGKTLYEDAEREARRIIEDAE